jgi:hypothetical protein
MPRLLADDAERRIVGAIHRARWHVDAARVELALENLDRVWRKANFNPNQPRMPAGSPDGGRWTSVGGDSESVGFDDPRILSDATSSPDLIPGAQYAQNRPPLGQFPGATPAQSARLAAGELRANSTIRRVREIEPAWQPRVTSFSAPSSIEGAIGHAEARAQAAEARLRELGRLPADRLIEAYAEANATHDLFGRQIWPQRESAIAVTRIEGQPVFGVPSGAPSHLYSSADAAVAGREVRALAESGWLRTPPNIGQIPYDSLYHAEATVLLRAYGLNRGTLAGQRLEVNVNRIICNSCLETLPHLGRRLGNPIVTFIDRSRIRRTMHGGGW